MNLWRVLQPSRETGPTDCVYVMIEVTPIDTR